jgi:hypothetical protein
MVCLKNISVDTLHKGNTDDDDDDDDDDNDNNNNNNNSRRYHHHHHQQQKPLVGFDFFDIFVSIFSGFDPPPPLPNASTCHIFCHKFQPS